MSGTNENPITIKARIAGWTQSAVNLPDEFIQYEATIRNFSNRDPNDQGVKDRLETFFQEEMGNPPMLLPPHTSC